MKTKILALFITLVMVMAFCVPVTFADTYTIDDINSLYTSMTNYIEENIDAIKANIRTDADNVCGYASSLAISIANEGDENLTVVYELLYSVYAYVMLVVNNESTKQGAIEIYTHIADDFLTDEYFDVIDKNADEKNIKKLITEKKYDELYEFLEEAVYNYITYISMEAESLLSIKENINAKPDKEHFFEDVEVNDWFYNAVYYVKAMGLFKGTSENKFSPQGIMTRGMFITVLQRFAHDSAFESTKNHGYKDVFEDDYYFGGVAWAKEADIIDWVDGDEFYPNKPITREEMISSLYKLAKKAEKIYEYDSIISDVLDKDNIELWAIEGMDWAYGTGVIKGYGDNNINPKGTAIRAEVAQVFLNYFAVVSITK